ncbi:MAG: hypothetical protein SP1CHLAM54_02960 [Chlamydiia bacterium]|nr:hypothetical protein [Chlamydiia bacterium]MCH9615212.1 hypothetical protein [Chlamydiia bacterium]MCH9628466.1 hypothetical protein [Chlamydiia bacterium]
MAISNIQAGAIHATEHGIPPPDQLFGTIAKPIIDDAVTYMKNFAAGKHTTNPEYLLGRIQVLQTLIYNASICDVNTTESSMYNAYDNILTGLVSNFKNAKWCGDANNQKNIANIAIISPNFSLFYYGKKWGQSNEDYIAKTDFSQSFSLMFKSNNFEFQQGAASVLSKIFTTRNTQSGWADYVIFENSGSNFLRLFFGNILKAFANPPTLSSTSAQNALGTLYTNLLDRALLSEYSPNSGTSVTEADFTTSNDQAINGMASFLSDHGQTPHAVKYLLEDYLGKSGLKVSDAYAVLQSVNSALTKAWNDLGASAQGYKAYNNAEYVIQTVQNAAGVQATGQNYINDVLNILEGGS